MKAFLAVAVALMIAPASANAAVETLATSAGSTMSFAAFDPSLGDLNSVTLTLHLDLGGVVTVLNSTSDFLTVSATDTVAALIQTPDAGAPIPEEAFTAPVTLLAPPGFVLDRFQSDALITVLDPAPAPADFSGPAGATVVYGARFVNHLDAGRVDGVGVFDQGVGVLGGVATLTYDYTPAVSAAPEPASWAIMMLGFGGLGSALRSRRRGVRAA